MNRQHKTHDFFNYALRGLGFIAVGSLLAAPSFAATPTAYLENAQVFATGKKIQAFRVPTTDVDGKVKYYNLTIDLNVLNDGTIDTVAADINAVLSPTVSSLKFISGNYSDGSGTACTVATSTLQGGRMEVSLSCKRGSSYYIQAGAVSGLIAGHPFELDLKAAGIDKIPGYGNYAWGKIATAYNNGYSWWDCMGTNDIISARQVGNTIAISGYDTGNTLKCGVVLTKK